MRRGSNPDGGAGSASRLLVNRRGPAGSHRRSFTKKVSRPAPLTHSPAPAATRAPAAFGSVLGSAPGLARAPAAATAPSPRGPGRVRLELTVPPARRARRLRAPCSRRAARRRGNPQHPPKPRTRARARGSADNPRNNRASAHSPRPLPACPASCPRSWPLFPALQPPPPHPSCPAGALAVLRSAPPPAALRTTPGQVPSPLPYTAPFASPATPGLGRGCGPGGNYPQVLGGKYAAKMM